MELKDSIIKCSTNDSEEIELNTLFAELNHYRNSHERTKAYIIMHYNVGGLYDRVIKVLSCCNDTDKIAWWYLYEECCIMHNHNENCLAAEQKDYKADIIDCNKLKAHLKITDQRIDNAINNRMTEPDTASNIEPQQNAKRKGDKEFEQRMALHNEISARMINDKKLANVYKKLKAPRGGFLSNYFMPRQGVTSPELAHIAKRLSQYMFKENKWKMFEDCWNVKYLRQYYYQNKLDKEKEQKINDCFSDLPTED